MAEDQTVYRAAYDAATQELADLTKELQKITFRKMWCEAAIRALSVQLGLPIPKELELFPRRHSRKSKSGSP